MNTDVGDGPPHRRRRRRATRPQGAPSTTPTTAPAEPEPAAPPGSTAAPDKPARKRRAPRPGGTERGLRDLVGAGRSQLGVSGALRARDVNRPDDEDLAAAERAVVIVRRNWKPPAPS
jgi:hypothetical protein